MTAWTDARVVSGGVEIAVRDYGGSGGPIVLVHGGPGLNLATWDGFAPRLADGFRVIAYDQRGHGRSHEADEYSYAALAGDLHAVVAALGLQRPVVVGHSWGGLIVLTYAAAYRECARVVAVDGAITDALRGAECTEDDWRRLERELRSHPAVSFQGGGAPRPTPWPDRRRPDTPTSYFPGKTFAERRYRARGSSFLLRADALGHVRIPGKGIRKKAQGEA